MPDDFNPTRMCLYDVQWQVVRVSLLGKWNDVQVYQALRTCSTYLSSQYYSKVACYRVLNLCAAVRMGFSGQQRRGSLADNEVAMYAQRIKEIYRTAKGSLSDCVPTPSSVASAWALLDPKTQEAIRSNLQKRLDLHSLSAHREELRWFLSLIGGRV